jgi:hypothetical protein
MSKEMTIQKGLEAFAEAVTAKTSQLTPGEPEEQLRGPLENFMAVAAGALGWSVVCTGETRLPGRLGKPDYAVHVNKLLAGYVELKAPGVGANPKRFSGHNRDQWKRFQSIPNLLYCDGNEWGLYRSGELVDKLVRLSGDIATDGKKAVGLEDPYAIERLLRGFFSWEPMIPRDGEGKIQLRRFAEQLARLCGMLRDDVSEAVRDPSSPLVELAKDWRQLLFPDASDEQFADAYAQTVTFALLLGRSEGAHPLTLESAEKALCSHHSLLSRALQVLTDPSARAEMSASLDVLLRIIGALPSLTVTGPSMPSLPFYEDLPAAYDAKLRKEPWFYFYEDFLAAYDPKLRKDAGAYYTPIQVVRAQVRLIGEILVNRLGKALGFADPGVVTLDPAVGTGTYHVGVIEHALRGVEAAEGAGAVPGRATSLAANLYGFEKMVGPFAVTELRVTRALRDRGATLPEGGPHIYLTDTLESPHAKPALVPLFLKPIAEQHSRALKVKSDVPVIVCLGNPPYDRHEAVDTQDEDSLSRCGGWVRFGDPLPHQSKRDEELKTIKLRSRKSILTERETRSILRDFIHPAARAGHGLHLKNVYNLYVYFWRWALWKVFEHETATGPGVVSFISASSYLDGDAFCGMREHMRRLCDEIWILDLGGEGRGTRKTDNVFAIQTPVAIALAVRLNKARKHKPAKVHYARIEGTREEKLAALDAIADFGSVMWQDCPDDWQAPFRAAGKGRYFDWPLLSDLMPWQATGVMAGRTWVIAPTRECIEERWHRLLQTSSKERADLFIENATGRKVTDRALSLRSPRKRLTEIGLLSLSAPCPNIETFGFRFLDRQFLLADGRMIDRPCPDLWACASSDQIYVLSLLNHPLGSGPALSAYANIPDKHAFRGSYGGKNVFALYRKADAAEPNVLPGLLDVLRRACNRKVTAEDFIAYVYGALAQPAFTARHAKELETRELRVPLTKDAVLFEKVRAVGARLLWQHTYGERFVPKGEQRGQVPLGQAKCVKAVPGDPDGYAECFNYNDATQTLHVGDGQFRPVAREVFEFEVSGLKVVQSWLKYRMKKGAGKKSSPLDDIRPERWTSQFTTELLELLWVLEATVEGYPEQAKLLDAVVAGPCFRADELPEVPEEMCKSPSARPSDDALFGDL